MKAKNHVIYGDESTLTRLMRDYLYIGRPCELQPDGNGGARLVIFALPPKPVKGKAKHGPRRGR